MWISIWWVLGLCDKKKMNSGSALGKFYFGEKFHSYHYYFKIFQMCQALSHCRNFAHTLSPAWNSLASTLLG